MTLKLASLVVISFFVMLAISVFVTDLSIVVPAVYVLLSLTTFIAYAVDKSAARNGRWRISESTLHLLSLACGWPGGLWGQQWLRHKTKKSGFLIVFSFVVILNCLFLGWLHTTDGRSSTTRLVVQVEHLFESNFVDQPKPKAEIWWSE